MGLESSTGRIQGGVFPSSIMMGVIQNQKVRMTLRNWAVSRRYTCRPDTTQPKPTANSPTRNIRTGRKIRNALNLCIQMAAPATIRVSANRWLTSDDKNTETGTISEGKTVLVIRDR